MAKESFLIDGEAITVRLSSAALRALDDWRQKQTNTPDRAEAICRLVGQLTLADVRPIAAESQNKAAELASREIDKLGAKSVMAKNARNASDISSKGPLNSGKSAPDERRAKSRAGATALLAPAPYAPTPPRVRPNCSFHAALLTATAPFEYPPRNPHRLRIACYSRRYPTS